MLQNKLLFNQSSVSLEIIGLPDLSNDENINHISIISQWKLSILDKPLIEGNLDHLVSIIKAFYSYSNSLLNNESSLYESKLIDIIYENFYTHSIFLKSSKPKVKPLNLKIGNSVLADIINCFDQLGASDKVKNIYSNEISKNKNYLNLFDLKKISNSIIPPIVSLFSIILVSSAFIYFYEGKDNNDNRSLLNSKNKIISIKPINKLL
tara:strand:+ start:42 stop:665 length:624 start_codon:yes stop_codon:yes gene_type:complete